MIGKDELECGFCYGIYNIEDAKAHGEDVCTDYEDDYGVGCDECMSDYYCCHDDDGCCECCIEDGELTCDYYEEDGDE